MIARHADSGILALAKELSETPKAVNQFPGGRPTNSTLGEVVIKDIRKACIKAAGAEIEMKTLILVLIWPFPFFPAEC